MVGGVDPPVVAQTTAFIDSLLYSIRKYCKRLKWAKKMISILTSIVLFLFQSLLSLLPILQLWKL